jgi:hypothetical protein
MNNVESCKSLFAEPLQRRCRMERETHVRTFSAQAHSTVFALSAGIPRLRLRIAW